jgi:hypothetical protein
MKIDTRNQEQTETSSVVRSYFYDTGTKTLLVSFGGPGLSRLYAYHDVPYNTFRNFKRSKSKGAAFNRLIRGRFTEDRLASVERFDFGTVRFLG